MRKTKKILSENEILTDKMSEIWNLLQKLTNPSQPYTYDIKRSSQRKKVLGIPRKNIFVNI